MEKAMFWTKKPNNAVQCRLCAHNCKIADGKRGICKVRVNKDGTLYTTLYGLVSPGIIDPIEKKPLYHFYPGSKVYSFGSISCNFKCTNCQNWQISQAYPEGLFTKEIPPENAVSMAVNYGCSGIAWTYNEPTVWFEYTYKGSKFAKKKGLYTVYISNGYINPEPLKKISPYLDALNIDIKSIHDDFYRKVCKGRLEPVLNTAKLAVKLGKHLEIAHLVIPTLNDEPEQFRELSKWIFENLGPDTPLHLSRFHPDNKLKHIPITPEKTLVNAYKIAKDVGLKYVFLGNIYHPRYGNTYCPKCGHLVLRRGSSFGLKGSDLVNGKCSNCNEKILNYY